MTRKSWVQINGKLIPKEEAHLYDHKGVMILPDIEPFVSPITGETIRGRSHLRQHMKEHGVTNIGDYSPEYFQKKQIERSREMLGMTQEARRERIELLKQALER
jgi:hypothetical protein